MTVVDSSVVVDLLLDEGAVDQVQAILRATSRPPSAPDLLVFEVVSALRRIAARGATVSRIGTAVSRLDELSIDLFPSMRLRTRAWELRHDFSVGDALFVALAEALGEPLATRDAPLARAAAAHTGIEIQPLSDD